MNFNLSLTKRAAFNYIFLFFVINSAAQNSKLISGVITDATTRKPIPHVEVFISGTTIGTTTNEKGNYSLSVPFFPCTLVADHISYYSFVKNINRSENELPIKLKPYHIEVSTIEVTGKNNRKRNLKFFYSHFISENKKDIEILNDSVLIFKRNNKEFVAFTKEPLIIINRILGYKIKLKLVSFKLFRTEFPGGSEIPLNSNKGREYGKLTGYFYYEQIETNSLKQMLRFEKNRRSSYFGSETHFLKSVYNQNTEEQGFEMQVYPEGKDLLGFKVFKNYDKGNDRKNFLMDADSIKITYKFGKDRYPYPYENTKNSTVFNTETSKIYRTGNILSIGADGTSPDACFVIVGPMAPGTYFANSLPRDYSPFSQ